MLTFQRLKTSSMPATASLPVKGGHKISHFQKITHTSGNPTREEKALNYFTNTS